MNVFVFILPCEIFFGNIASTTLLPGEGDGEELSSTLVQLVP